ncbi:hypothetical protein, partial [Actinomadura roseirufa]|uniref:hypothetical protein n=1 Tax=Actinomadura roseirufa TaxID=2094049 RepID=UPI001A95474D
MPRPVERLLEPQLVLGVDVPVPASDGLDEPPEPARGDLVLRPRRRDRGPGRRRRGSPPASPRRSGSALARRL